MTRGPAYLLIFAVVGVVAAVVALATSLTLNMTRCDNREAGPDVFLADCNAFGNFEHGAYFYDLEPVATESIRKADILFLGDSHAQYAFSTAQTDAFFAGRDQRHYLLGFGYGEGSAFIQALAARLDLHPRALVINANPYFSNVRATPAERILGRRAPLTRVEYLLKARAIVFAHALCARFALTCSGPSPTIYRTRTTGHWRVGGFDTQRTYPLAPGAKPATETQVADAARHGAEFLSALHVAPSCVVLTGIPDGTENFDAAAFAAAIAQRLGAKVLNIAVPEMQSIDGSHMTADTAARWSEAFFAQLGPLLDGCVSAGG